MPPKGPKRAAGPKKPGRKAAEVDPDFDLVDRAVHRLEILEATGATGGNYRDFSYLKLKKDHANRPIWVTPTGYIFLEATSPIYHQAYDFLVAIAEPVARPEYVHEYRLTPYSLYAAMAVSIQTSDIIRVLNRLCKTELPREVEDYINACTLTYGKAKLVLRHNRFHVESADADVLRILLTDDAIATARDGEVEQVDAAQEMKENLGYQQLGEDAEEEYGAETGLGDMQLRNVSFPIKPQMVEEVKRAAIRMDYPLMEEYDFRGDTSIPSLNIDLKPLTRIRTYQEKSLSKMFGNGRARSGIIVLPCGAGKSLTGVTACQTIKKSCIILCIHTASVRQWKAEFERWTTIKSEDIRMFTSDSKEPLPPNDKPVIVLTTYSMICAHKRAAVSELVIGQIEQREWALMVLDEVHVTPAHQFRKVLSKVHAHCKLGLTATLVREDGLIDDLNFLIGPKLYEANWMDLTQQGYLANVQCVEVWCPMTAEFMSEHLRTTDNRRKQLLCVMNPNKMRVCQYLMNYHKERGDKVIIFSDNVSSLKLYGRDLRIPYIFGDTTESERRRWLDDFKRLGSSTSVIGLSKVGDTALDIPEANVVIQLSGHGGSRRQEAQRLGRILRPKSTTTEGFNAFFYTLVSPDTSEMRDAAKRQRYLIDQGYTYKVVQDLWHQASISPTVTRLRTKAEEVDLLARALQEDIATNEDKEDAAVRRQGGLEDEEIDARPAARRRSGNIDSMSGADGLRYTEYDASVRSEQPSRKVPRVS